MKFLRVLFIVVVVSGFSAFKSAPSLEFTTISNIQTSEELNQSSVLSFAVISDNHGIEPYDDIRMARMAKWVRDSKDEFVLGIGDHVSKDHKIGGFPSFVRMNEWWSQNFYPIISDAENAFYGKGQDDWGSGGKFLSDLNIDKRENVQMRDNKCEYYSQIKAKGYTIHFIALHFPDQPYDVAKAFPEDSRNYLVNTVKNIRKSPKDVIVVAAHSMWGTWIDYLNPEQKKIVMEKCDLVLAGTTHYYEKQTVKGYENSGALVLNAGSVTSPRFGSPAGYLQIHIMEHPFAVVAQFINTEEERMQLRSFPFAYQKDMNGRVSPLNFNI